MYNTTINLRYAARESLGRAICMSGDDDERRHAQRVTLVLPSCPSSTRVNNAIDRWMNSNSWREVVNTSARL